MAAVRPQEVLGVVEGRDLAPRQLHELDGSADEVAVGFGHLAVRHVEVVFESDADVAAWVNRWAGTSMFSLIDLIVISEKRALVISLRITTCSGRW